MGITEFFSQYDTHTHTQRDLDEEICITMEYVTAIRQMLQNQHTHIHMHTHARNNFNYVNLNLKCPFSFVLILFVHQIEYEFTYSLCASSGSVSSQPTQDTASFEIERNTHIYRFICESVCSRPNSGEND